MQVREYKLTIIYKDQDDNQQFKHVVVPATATWSDLRKLIEEKIGMPVGNDKDLTAFGLSFRSNASATIETYLDRIKRSGASGASIPYDSPFRLHKANVGLLQQFPGAYDAYLRGLSGSGSIFQPGPGITNETKPENKPNCSIM